RAAAWDSGRDHLRSLPRRGLHRGGAGSGRSRLRGPRPPALREGGGDPGRASDRRADRQVRAVKQGFRSAAALLLGALLGCAGTTPDPATPGGHLASPAAAQGDTTRQVMVTYPAAPPFVWSQTTAELTQTYHLRVIFAWTMASIGEHCVVFEVPRGR